MADLLQNTARRVLYLAHPDTGDDTFPVWFTTPLAQPLVGADVGVYVAGVKTLAFNFDGSNVTLPGRVYGVTVEIVFEPKVERVTTFPTTGFVDMEYLNRELDRIYAIISGSYEQLDSLPQSLLPRGVNVPDRSMERLVRSICIIPGATEWGYATTIVERDGGITENAHTGTGLSDFVVSLNDLQARLPNVRHVVLVVGWVGTSTDVATCLCLPGTENVSKVTTPLVWSVAGLTRAQAHPVSYIGESAAYGSTPADQSVLEALGELRRRGIGVTMYPFLFMDTHGYPWRGRITAASDGTAQARVDTDLFFERADGYRRMVLHMANLCKMAGGVHGFCVGSEMVGITKIRDAAGAYPGVEQMSQLVVDVRQLGGVAANIGYAADWTEYHSDRRGGDVIFNMDPLWAQCDFIGIDNYLPMSDWRDGEDHLDARLGWHGPHDIEYLKWSMVNGENRGWYYGSPEDRDAQIRTPITDGLAGEHWIYAQGDVTGWWANPHHNRVNGVRSGSPTSWTPQSKPVWFTEFGVPAVDKGPNQPNVFVDPKSSESFVPYYSTGKRNDYHQRAGIIAFLEHWQNSPRSTVYSLPMVDMTTCSAWCWDARPWPWFPTLSAVWGDWENYRLGHWLNGRVGFGEPRGLDRRP